MPTPTIATLKQKQALLWVLMFTFATVMIWIGFVVFRSQQSTGISADLMALSQPLNPNIDASALDRIQKKRSFGAAELTTFPFNRIILQNGEDVIVQGPGPIPTSPSPIPIGAPPLQ